MILSRPVATKPPPGARVNLAHPLMRGVQAAWLFNEGDGLYLNDAAKQHPTIITNEVAVDLSRGSGRYGTHLTHTGNENSSYARTPYRSDLGFTHGRMSMEAIFYPISSNYGWIVTHPPNNTTHQAPWGDWGFLWNWPNSGGMGFLTNDAPGTNQVNTGSAAGTYPIGAWYHAVIAVDLDADTVSFYKNGNLVQTNTGFSGVIRNTASADIVLFSNAGGEENPNISLAYLALYDYPLTAEIVKAKYLAPFDGFLAQSPSAKYFLPAAGGGGGTTITGLGRRFQGWTYRQGG